MLLTVYHLVDEHHIRYIFYIFYESYQIQVKYRKLLTWLFSALLTLMLIYWRIGDFFVGLKVGRDVFLGNLVVQEFDQNVDLEPQISNAKYQLISAKLDL
jgi:hypothetical protein